MNATQHADFAYFFINENSNHVIDTLKKVIGINKKLLYTMEFNQEDKQFIVYDEKGAEHFNFSVKYHPDHKEFELSLNVQIDTFQKYSASIIYYCGVILDARLTYQRTELYFCLRQFEYSLAFSIDKDGIYVSYISDHSVMECYELISKKFMSRAFDLEITYLLDLFVNYKSIFDSYTIAELFSVRDNILALYDMKKVSDMLNI